MFLESKPPHDFYLALDADWYFEEEYDADEIFKGGFARPINLAERTVLAVMHYNDNPVEPGFEVEFPDQDAPTGDEEADARRQLGRVVGTDLDTAAFAQRVRNDAALRPLVDEHYGFKRITRACFFDDAFRHIIRTRISHEPTRKRMVLNLRKRFGQAFQWRGRAYYAYPRPQALRSVDPGDMREFGISRSKAEFVIGLAELIASGTLDQWALEAMSPEDFWVAATAVRGIGPSTAQSLMLRRNRTDGTFMSRKSTSGKDKGREKGWRHWILPHYGVDSDTATEDDYEAVRDHWRGYEAMVSQLLFFDELMTEQKQKYERS